MYNNERFDEMKVMVEVDPLDRDDCTPEEQAEIMAKLLLAAGWTEMEYDPINGSVYTVSKMPHNSERYGIIWKVVDQ